MVQVTQASPQPLEQLQQSDCHQQSSAWRVTHCGMAVCCR